MRLARFLFRGETALLLISLVCSAQAAPVLYEGGVVNAADYTADFAPGSIISLWGNNFSTATVLNDSIPVRTELGGVQVEVLPASGNPVLAPLFMVSPGQINAQLPFGLSGTVRVRIRNSAGVSAERTINITNTAPKLFTWTMDGKGQPIALHADYSSAVSAHPLRPGEWAIVWLTGLGAVNPPLGAGQPGGDNGRYGPLNWVTSDVTISIGGKTVTPEFKGAAPGYAGLYQINFKVPEDTPAGLQPFAVTGGGRSSQAGITIPVDFAGEVLGAATVGPAGGKVAGQGVSLEAPPGAFSENQTIEIIRLSAQPEDSSSLLTNVFEIKGIPPSYSAPLTLRLPVIAGAPSSEDAVVFIKIQGDQSAGEAPKGIPGKIEGGVLTVVLPALPPDESSLPASPAGGPPAEKAIVQSSRLTQLVWALGGLKWHTSDSGRFRMYAPDGHYGSVRSLLGCLDRAWTRLGNMGLDTSLRKTEIQVFLYSYRSRLAWLFGEDTNNVGASESDLWGEQNVGLTINLDALSAPDGPEEACITAGHELMHIVQSLYDPRGRTRKTLTHSPWLWMLEASATWFERAVSSQSDYLPPNFRNNFPLLFNTPLEVQPGWWSNNGARAHGYAASALLQFIDPVSPTTGGATVAGVIRQMAEKESGLFYDSSKYSPTEALIRAYSALSNNWGDFAKNLAEGKVFSGNTFPMAVDWLGLRGQFPVLEFPDGSREARTATLNMGDLSIHPVFLRFSKWSSTLDANTPLTLTLTDPSSRAGVHLYRITSNGLEFVRTFTSNYSYQAANQLVQDGATLLAIIYQSRAVAPYTGTTAVSLTAQLGDDILKYLQQVRSVYFSVSSNLMCRQGSTETVCAAGVSKSGLDVSFGGTYFSGEGTVPISSFPPFSPDYDERDNVPLHYKVEGTVNSTGTKIINMTIEFKRTADKTSGNQTYRRTDELVIALVNLPLAYNITSTYNQNSKVFQFRVGANVGAYIGGVSGKSAWGRVIDTVFEETSSWTYTRFDVQSGNVIDVRFSK